MARKKSGERVLGPYEEQGKDGRVRYRIIEIDAQGNRTPSDHDSLRDAEIYKADIVEDLDTDTHSTETAIDKYKKYLETKGNKTDSVRQTIWIIGLMFPASMLLAAITPKRAQKLYDEMRERPTARTGKPPSVDTHRSALAQTRTFLSWCREQGWYRDANPFAEVKGVGKRRPRGKSLGKAGRELRIKEARAWYRRALVLADEGDEGAVAALVDLLLGLRASEIVTRKVEDIDDDERTADAMWIDDAKTPAGRRSLEIPEVLSPFIMACCEGKTGDRYLFECQREQDPIGKPHARDWVIDQVHRICDDVKIPHVTAHALRGLLATIAKERGMAGRLVADMLGHEEERTSDTSYARPGSAAAGARRLGIKVLNGGVQVRKKEG